MNALAMIRRCGERQQGGGAAPMVFLATTSHESAYVAPVSVYTAEEEMGDRSRPLPMHDTEAWA